MEVDHMSTEPVIKSQIDFDKDKFYVADNFLPEDQFLELQKSLVWNTDFPFYMVQNVGVDKRVSTPESYEKEIANHWSWFSTHTLYQWDVPCSEYFDSIQKIFLPIFYKMGVMNALIRMKVNFYPHTTEIHEHSPHQDTSAFIKAALFSLNTCDGFTRMHDGSKIDSVANRVVFFDGSQLHNSSTTTNAKARYKINFNFL